LYNSHNNFAFLEKYQPFDQFLQFDQLNQLHKDVNLFGQTVKIGQILGQLDRTLPPHTKPLGQPWCQPCLVLVEKLGHIARQPFHDCPLFYYFIQNDICYTAHKAI